MNELITVLTSYAISYGLPLALAFIGGKLMWAVNKAANAFETETGVKIDFAKRNKLHAAVLTHVNAIAVEVLADGKVTMDEVLDAVVRRIRAQLPSKVVYTNPGDAAGLDGSKLVDIALQYAPEAIAKAKAAL